MVDHELSEDQVAISIDGKEIEVVSVFRYLGVIVEGCGSSMSHVEDHVAKA